MKVSNLVPKTRKYREIKFLPSDFTRNESLISKLVLMHCENFTVRPSFYDQMSDKQKEKIKDFFEENIGHDKYDREDKNLYLFY